MQSLDWAGNADLLFHHIDKSHDVGFRPAIKCACLVDKDIDSVTETEDRPPLP